MGGEGGCVSATRDFVRDGKLEVALVQDLIEGAESIAIGNTDVVGGLVGNMTSVTVHRRNAEDLHCVLKCICPERIPLSLRAGLAREAAFYKEFAPEVAEHVRTPNCLVEYHDFATGAKSLLLEAVAGIQAGLLFGPGSPLNTGRDLRALTEGVRWDAMQVTEAAFAQITQLHKRYLNYDAGQPRCDWLRTTHDADMWEAERQRLVLSWERSGKGCAGQVCHPVDAVIRAVLSVPFPTARTYWTNKFPQTLIHGDFHPGNAMVSTSPNTRALEVTILDWEAVGVGSGPQDLAQWLVSHATPTLRREWERGGLGRYAQEMSLGEEAVRGEYARCGVGRWAFLLVLLVDMVDDASLAYFTSQLAEFVGDWSDTVNGDWGPLRL